jgi:hypothetical protein
LNISAQLDMSRKLTEKVYLSPLSILSSVIIALQ